MQQNVAALRFLADKLQCKQKCNKRLPRRLSKANRMQISAVRIRWMNMARIDWMRQVIKLIHIFTPHYGLNAAAYSCFANCHIIWLGFCWNYLHWHSKMQKGWLQKTEKNACISCVVGKYQAKYLHKSVVVVVQQMQHSFGCQAVAMNYAAVKQYCMLQVLLIIIIGQLKFIQKWPMSSVQLKCLGNKSKTT